jgi:hypothetical protein
VGTRFGSGGFVRSGTLQASLPSLIKKHWENFMCPDSEELFSIWHMSVRAHEKELASR